MTRHADELPRPPLREPAALFGKLPWCADYVRVHHTQPAAIALDSWLQASMQPLARARVGWPTQRVHFLYTAPGAATRLAGVLAPSRDRAGRKFPVSVFARVPSVGPEARGPLELAALPRTLAGFLDAAEELIERGPSLDRAGVERALRELPLPRSTPVAGITAELASRSALQLAHAMFTDDVRARTLAAWANVVEAIGDWRASSFAQAPVLAAPLRSLQDLEAWLALVGRVRGESMGAASVFWTPRAPEPRMLLALGALPASLPLWLAQPAERHERLLPLAPEPRSKRLPAVSDQDWQLSSERFTTRVAQLLEELRFAR
jgi:type VI secretion system ImpM family protein